MAKYTVELKIIATVNADGKSEAEHMVEDMFLNGELDGTSDVEYELVTYKDY